MKKTHSLISVFVSVALAFAVAGCQIDSDRHEHSFSKDWTSNATDHWHAATCGHTKEVSDKTAHTFGDWKTTVEATEETEGKKERSCSVCSYKEEQSLAKLDHTHKFSSDWTSNAIDHWHAATCGHTKEVSEKAEHTFGDWTVTKEATEEAEGSKERSCSVCGYTATEAIEKLAHTHKFAEAWISDETNHWHAATCEHTKEVSGKAEHSFGDYVSNNDATTEADGTKTRECSVCGYKDTVTDEGSKIHVHIFAEEWTSDASGHWHAAACGHTDEKSGFAEHTFGEYVSNNDATTEADGTKTRECSVCGYKDTVTDEGSKIIVPEGFVFVKGTTVNGNESWTPASNVFVSERTITIPDMYVCDHEVTRGEFKEVMGTDPSEASAYNKDGNKLTGDAVLNNPVNYVNWYDAIVYCNKLSLKENLTPCYSVSGVTDWENLDYSSIPTKNDTNWNALTYDKEADGYRLPTEAEWEWLARGGENYTYAGSNTVGDVAWYKYNTDETGSREVKTKQANGYGLYDMSGNVCEWCYDWYATVSSSTADTGASYGSDRVLRGGSWCRYDYRCRVSDRNFGFPDDRYYRPSANDRCDDYGFRVVRSSSK